MFLNFFTSSFSSGYKAYSLACIALLLPVFLLVNIVAWYGLEPYSNDLTRTGGYLESQYGWRGSYPTIDAESLPLVYGGETYTSCQDVVVLGDSFSYYARPGWLGHFVDVSGLSTQVFHINLFTIDDLIQSPGFARCPPKLVIYQQVERTLSVFFSGRPSQCGPVVEGTAEISLPTNPLGSPTRLMTRDRTRQHGDYQLAFSFLRNEVYRRLRWDSRLKARVTELSRPGLFSSKNDRELLFLSMDLIKEYWEADLPYKVACTLEEYRGKVESNEDTRFLAMLVPDKLSAYSAVLKDDTGAGLSILGAAPLRSLPANLPLYDWIIGEVGLGFPDLYYPSDSHWSPRGELAVAIWLTQQISPDRSPESFPPLMREYSGAQ